MSGQDERLSDEQRRIVEWLADRNTDARGAGGVAKRFHLKLPDAEEVLAEIKARLGIYTEGEWHGRLDLEQRKTEGKFRERPAPSDRLHSRRKTRQKKKRRPTNTSPLDPLESTLQELQLTDPLRHSRLKEALESLGEVRRTWEATEGLPMSEDKAIEGALLRYESAALECVEIDKRMLYLSPDVRWCIDYAERWGRGDFFSRLSDAMGVGISVDQRLQGEPDWPARQAVMLYQVGRKLADGRREKLTWSDVFMELGRIAETLTGRSEKALREFFERFGDHRAMEKYLRRRGFI